MYTIIEIIIVMLALVGGIYFTVNKKKFKDEIERKKKESRSS